MKLLNPEYTASKDGNRNINVEQLKKDIATLVNILIILYTIILRFLPCNL